MKTQNNGIDEILITYDMKLELLALKVRMLDRIFKRNRTNLG